jgi:hypothetical protein
LCLILEAQAGENNFESKIYEHLLGFVCRSEESSTPSIEESKLTALSSSWIRQTGLFIRQALKG